MAKRNTKTVQDVQHNKPIPRSYDPMAMEQRIYNLEKNAGGGSSQVNPFNYSTNEVEIGEWLEGKKLYRKVFTLTGSTVSAGSWATIDIDITDITIINAVAIGWGQDGTYARGVQYGAFYVTNQGKLGVRTTVNEKLRYVILDYVKEVLS